MNAVCTRMAPELGARRRSGRGRGGGNDFPAVTSPGSLLDSQSDCLMEMPLAIVSFTLPAMEKELGT